MDEHDEKIGGVGKVVEIERPNLENGSITGGEEGIQNNAWVLGIMKRHCP